MFRPRRVSWAEVIVLLLTVHDTFLIASSTPLSKSRLFAAATPTPSVSTTTATKTSTSSNTTPKQQQGIMTDGDILIVFSDVDGTLVHYPEQASERGESDGLLRLPPSSTGMQGIISHLTLSRCQELRRKRNKKLVLVSGMRTATLWKRIPFLPKADAYCSEVGGRIFFPVHITDAESYQGPIFQPRTYEGATEDYLTPFGLREDREWRALMEETVGADGFLGMALVGSRQSDPPVPISDRSGSLWKFCRELESKGVVVDTKGYSTCFRVNRKQQKDVHLFDELLVGALIEIPDGLATSTNLGCIDFYPVKSGKKNCCAYLTRKLLATDVPLMESNAVCLCDDDNDLEMALACHHAFVPGISSDSMRQTIAEHASHITVTGGVDGLSEGTEATDRALLSVLERVRPPNSELGP